MDNLKNSYSFPKEESYQFKNGQGSNVEKNNDLIVTQQIEFLLQKQLNISIPALVIDFSKFNSGQDTPIDTEDFNEVMNHFGKCEQIDTNYSKILCFLFMKFFDAYNAKEFLMSDSNYKDPELNSLDIKWLNHLNDLNLSDQIKKNYHKKQNFTPHQSSEYKPMNMGNQFSQNSTDYQNKNIYSVYQNNYNISRSEYIKNSMEINSNPLGGMGQNLNKTNSNSNINPNQLYSEMNSKLNITPKVVKNDSKEFINTQPISTSLTFVNNSQKKDDIKLDSPDKNVKTVSSSSKLGALLSNKSAPSNKNPNIKIPNQVSLDLDDKKNSEKYMVNGKYTCRFDIQIENDNQFQVARKIIGSSGCNMKKIVETCNQNSDGTYLKDSVKLRLRGKGSGYKEGPSQKESDEPLHLCISSKYYEKFKLASVLLTDLLNSIYDEYKKAYDKKSKYFIPNLAIKKTEGISSRKSTISKNEFDD